MAKSKKKGYAIIIIGVLVIATFLFVFQKQQSFFPDEPYKAIEIPFTAPDSVGGCRGSSPPKQACFSISPYVIEIPEYNEEDFLGFGIKSNMKSSRESSVNSFWSVMWDTTCGLGPETGRNGPEAICQQEQDIFQGSGVFGVGEDGNFELRVDKTKSGLDFSPGTHTLALSFNTVYFIQSQNTYSNSITTEDEKAYLFLKVECNTDDDCSEGFLCSDDNICLGTTGETQETNDTIDVGSDNQNDNVLDNTIEQIKNPSNNLKGIFIILASVFVLIIIFLRTRRKRK